jgi:ribosomal protein L11 methyltransferase
VRVAARHAALNGVEKEIICQHGDGFAAPAVVEQKFDLVIANILAAVLTDMADDAVRATAEKGHILLSGMLSHQADDVLAAYQARGCILHHRYDEKDWASLWLRLF